MGDEEEEPVPINASEQKNQEERTNMLVANFFFCIVWSIGADLDGDSRIKFDEFFRSLCDENNSKYPKYEKFNKNCK